MGTGLVRDAIIARLEAAGYEVTAAVVEGEQAVLAGRARFHWMLSRLQIFVFLFETAAADETTGEQLLSGARRYALAHKGGWHTGVASIPVVINEGEAARAKTWAQTRTLRRRDYGCIDLPVVIELPTGEVAYRRKQSLRGGAFLPQLRRLIEYHIVPAVRAAT